MLLKKFLFLENLEIFKTKLNDYKQFLLFNF